MGEYGLYHKQTCAPEGRQKKNMVQIRRSQISGTGFLGVGWGVGGVLGFYRSKTL